MSKQYRILSLDGGGSWAILQVKTLIDLYGEQTSGHQVLSHFNLVAANSGGSIVAAALAENYSLLEIYQLFRDESQRKKIFRKRSFLNKLNPVTWLGLAPRYRSTSKHDGLRELMPRAGRTPMDKLHIPGYGGQDVRFTFMSYDYDRDRASFMRSWNSRAGSATHDFFAYELADAVHASTNAPIQYFDAPAEFAGRRFWDGALTGYNNPVLAAVVEALADGVARDAIAVLSIGTASTVLPTDGTPADYVVPRAKAGLANDVSKAAKTILADPPDAATFIAHVALDQTLPEAPGQCISDSVLVRMNPLIQPVLKTPGGSEWRPPSGLSSADFKLLIAMDMDAVEDQDVDLIEQLWVCWQRGDVANQPIRPGKQGVCEIGNATYASGRQRWLSLAQ